MSSDLLTGVPAEATSVRSNRIPLLPTATGRPLQSNTPRSMSRTKDPNTKRRLVMGARVADFADFRNFSAPDSRPRDACSAMLLGVEDAFPRRSAMTNRLATATSRTGPNSIENKGCVVKGVGGYVVKEGSEYAPECRAEQDVGAGLECGS